MGKHLSKCLLLNFLAQSLMKNLPGYSIDKVQNKCKKLNNLLRCLSGRDWGAARGALMKIYEAIMRSTLDYGCIAYLSAAECHLAKLDRESQGLKICSGAVKASQVAALRPGTYLSG